MTLRRKLLLAGGLCCCGLGIAAGGFVASYPFALPRFLGRTGVVLSPQEPFQWYAWQLVVALVLTIAGALAVRVAVRNRL